MNQKNDENYLYVTGLCRVLPKYIPIHIGIWYLNSCLLSAVYGPLGVWYRTGEYENMWELFDWDGNGKHYLKDLHTCRWMVSKNIERHVLAHHVNGKGNSLAMSEWVHVFSEDDQLLIRSCDRIRNL